MKRALREYPRRFLIGALRGYQLYISGLHPGCCRYRPTCSQYAVEAIERFGALRGGLLALWRVLRCNPFSKGGYDPVPERFPSGQSAKQTANESNRKESINTK